MTVTSTDVQKAYLGYFGRPADTVGLAYWQTSTTTAMYDGFAASTEYANLYANMTATQRVSQVYVNVLGRTADTAGLTYWSTELALGRQTVSSLVVAMWANALGDDVTTLANRVTYANSFTAALDTAAEIVGYTGDAASAAARAAVLPITTTASLATATATLDASVATVVAAGSSSSGSTINLTTGADNFAGTVGNDVINGLAGATAAATTDTLSAADIINGGAGSDTLNVTTTAANLNVLMGAQVTNIETLNIRSTSGLATVDASNISGLTAVNANTGVGSVTVSNLATGASVGVIGNGVVVNGTTTFGYKTATDAATINVSGGTTGGNVTSTSASTAATINSTGAANTLGTVDVNTGATTASLTVKATSNLTATLAADYTATAALTVSGAAASVDLGAAANFKTIDASGLTVGGLTIAGGSNLTSYKGGQGNDVFTSAAAYGATTAGLVAAGTGTDTLILSAVSDMDSAAEAAMYTGFETLRTAGTQDMALLAGITAVQVGAATGLVTQMNATQAAAVQVRVAATSATFALADSAGTSDILKLSMGTGSLATAATGFSGALTVNGFETLDITTNAGPTATAGANQTTTIGSFVADKLTSIVLHGQAVNIGNAATTKAVTIDASALTGDGTVGLTLGGALIAGSTVTGSAVADAITMVGAGSTFNLGAGNDAISGALGLYRTGTTYNTIDGGAGTDTANITGGAALTMVDDDFKGMTNVEKITIATTALNDQTITTGGWFDANFKAAGATLTTTSTDGNVTIAAGSFTGNLTVVATTADTAGANAGIVTITTGSGNDTVTVSDTGSAAGSITTGAGNDIITGGGVVETITGGLGADTMTGGLGADIFAFSTNGSVAGTSMDIITDFAAASDVLTFAGAVTAITVDATAAAAGTNASLTAAGLLTFAAADNTLALKIATVQADTSLDAALSIAMFVDGANMYVYYAGAAVGNADDQIIQLTGQAALATITAGATVTIA